MRALGIAVGALGVIVGLGSFAGALLAHGAAVLLWLIPECAGLLMLLIGLHAWIEWGDQ